MSSVVLLAYYCVLVLLASIAGGMVPVWFRLTHRWMECAVSFVAGTMLGVALLDMLPHALVAATGSDGSLSSTGVVRVLMWTLSGLLAMFFVERFFCFHHHEAPGEVLLDSVHEHEHGACSHGPQPHTDHFHDITWSGAALGLGLHSVMNGVALAASVEDAHGGARLAGLGVFLAVFLHKPFDAMTIATLMAKGGWSIAARCVVNGLFALAVPVGVAVFYAGGMLPEASGNGVAYALAFSAGVFLCISMSDLLPELQFHHHDRLLLSLALIAGLAVAFIAGHFEAVGHSHAPPGVDM
jgi:zinc and cadmium transporter